MKAGLTLKYTGKAYGDLWCQSMILEVVSGNYPNPGGVGGIIDGIRADWPPYSILVRERALDS